MSTSTFPVTEHNRIRRHADRAHYDAETIYAILDAAMVGHFAFVREGQPMVIPALYARDGNRLVIHGHPASGLMQHIAAGGEVAVSVALLDGLVVTKSVAELSVNYRSATVFGHGRLLTDEGEKRTALRVLTERLVPGQWQAANTPSERHLRGVAVAEIAIESAAAKVRTGFPDDPPECRGLPVWAGYIPIQRTFGEPIPADYANTPLPSALADYLQNKTQRPKSMASK